MGSKRNPREELQWLLAETISANLYYVAFRCHLRASLNLIYIRAFVVVIVFVFVSASCWLCCRQWCCRQPARSMWVINSSSCFYLYKYFSKYVCLCACACIYPFFYDCSNGSHGFVVVFFFFWTCHLAFSDVYMYVLK